jgi:WD40 repeat protein
MKTAHDLKELGDAAYMWGRYEEAVENYNLAIEKINHDEHDNIATLSALHSNRCLCYIKLNKLHEAWQDAQTCILLRPRWGKAHLRCAAIADLQGRVAEALSFYQRAAELDTSLAEEVVSPIKRLEFKLSEQQCSAIMTPPSTNASSPIYYASLCPQPIQIGSETTHILAAAYGDGTIRLWCTTTGNLLKTLQQDNTHSQAVTVFTWSADGTMLASGSLDMTCEVWKLEDAEENSGYELEYKLVSVLKGHSGRVSAVKFASTQCTVITASTDLSIKVWKLSNDFERCGPQNSAECLFTLDGHSSLVSDIDVDPLDHKILVSASGDAQFKVWDLENNGQLLENVAWESGPVVLCGFLPSNVPLLLTAHAQLARQEGRILLWDVLEKKDGWCDGKLVAPAWSLDGFIGRPTSWDTCCCSLEEHTTEDVAYSSVLLAVACTDGSVRVWEILDTKTRPLELFGFEITTYRRNSKGNGNNEMPPWHAAALSQHQTAENAFKVKFSPRGELLAVTGGDANQVVSVWDIQHGEEVCAFAGHTDRIRSLEWSKDGKYLFTASEDGAIRKWHVEALKK